MCLVTQLCPAPCNPMDCSPLGSSVHGDSPGKNTRMGGHDFLPTQESNWGILHCRQILYQLNYQGSPYISLIYYISYYINISYLCYTQNIIISMSWISKHYWDIFLLLLTLFSAFEIQYVFYIYRIFQFGPTIYWGTQ